MTEPNQDIRVVRGAPTDEELAAAIAVVRAAVAAAEAEAAKKQETPTAHSTWNRNHGMFRGDVTAGAGQWQAALRNGLN